MLHERDGANPRLLPSLGSEFEIHAILHNIVDTAQSYLGGFVIQEQENLVFDQLLLLTASVEALNQVVSFLLAQKLQNAPDPESTLKVLALGLDKKISTSKLDRTKGAGEPIRVAIDKLLASTRTILKSAGEIS